MPGSLPLQEHSQVLAKVVLVMQGRLCLTEITRVEKTT